MSMQTGSNADLAKGELAYNEQDIIIECQQRFTFSQEGEGTNRSEFEFDKRFVDGDQWDPTIRDERFSDRRPALTVNITDAITRRVVNSCRENRPRIVAHPVGNGADIDTAHVINGLFRHIEYASTAYYWYDNALENSVQGGWGWLAIENVYLSDKSFDQELRIKGYSNPLMCYADPNSRMPDGSDMEWFIETEFMKRTMYREKFGELDPTGWRWVGRGDDVPDWSNKEEIRVAKYWRVELKKDRLIEYDDGQRLLQSDVGRLGRALGLKQVKSREVIRRQIVCYLLTSKKILKRTEWPGKWIPRVPVYGRRSDRNGRMFIKGMVRDLRDSARIYNYAETAKTEWYAMTSKAQWIGPEGFLDGHEAAFRDTNRKPIVALEYKPVQLPDGSYAPPPQRLDPPKPNAGFSEWADSTRANFMMVAGMPHEPSVDMQGEVISGKALKQRQALSDISNFDFYDNFCRSLCQVGRILLDLLPHFYGEERMIRIIRDDGTPQQVTINETMPLPNLMPGSPLPAIAQAQIMPQMSPKGPSAQTQAAKHIKNDLTIGDYEVIIDTGPSYQTKREQSAEAMLELLRTPAGQMITSTAADLMVRAMDFPNSDMVADRLTSMIPAALVDAELQHIPEAARGIVSGLQQRVRQLMMQNMQLSIEMETHMSVEQLKQQSETQRTIMREQAMTERERMKAKAYETDAQTRAGAMMHDTHVKAVTAHDTAEIGAAAQLMEAHVRGGYERERAKKLLEEATPPELTE
ncbi:MAG: hypothetical protein KGL39_13905 [Patescibacteria group bacterium]|nr:hypothetical protein [Patescibacteria group bacterium]